MSVYRLFTLILLSGLVASCSGALYRSYPKADRHAGEAAIPEQKERKIKQIVVPDEVAQASVQAHAVPSETAVVEPIASVASAVPAADQEAWGAFPVNDDTLEVDQEEHDFMIEQAEKSERLARELKGWGIATIAGLFFWPLYFIGIIGGIVTIARYNRLIYVSEKSMEIKRRAQKTFLVGVLLPLALIAFLLIIIFLSL